MDLYGPYMARFMVSKFGQPGSPYAKHILEGASESEQKCCSTPEELSISDSKPAQNQPNRKNKENTEQTAEK